MIYQRKEFLKTLERIGNGSSRNVYLLPCGTKVIKVAKNEKGIAQNEAEVYLYETIEKVNYVARIFWRSTRCRWIISEYINFNALTPYNKRKKIRDWFEKNTNLHEMLEFGTDKKGRVKLCDYGGTRQVLSKYYFSLS